MTRGSAVIRTACGRHFRTAREPCIILDTPRVARSASQVFADLVVACFFGLILRYVLHGELTGKGYFAKFLESGIWHPISELSYAAFLLQARYRASRCVSASSRDRCAIARGR